ncbi:MULTISPECIES: hypothetical protein [unclassified Amycolatopsis]|uniref:hypothetical protein n=1 Tax=unclassified Amycolatopsis TaxID=2618356 RepID=UPI001FF579A6|nr:hypothetical protein [Amycolatopsis sp. FBCC-B4732]UOX85109.1 hypothetical protein MUY14_25270 [Amycolatopsis sp. FBCC-B4732]
MRALNRTILVIAAAGIAGTAGVLTAQGSEIAASDQPPSVVEDYSYPGAAALLATDHVQLISGDGHIVYTPCPTGQDTVGVIQVKTTEAVGQSLNGRVCFKVLGTGGELTMKIPAVYAIRSDGLSAGQGHKLKASLTTDAGVHSSVDVPSDGITQVGVGADPNGDPTTLLELVATAP